MPGGYLGEAAEDHARGKRLTPSRAQRGFDCDVRSAIRRKAIDAGGNRRKRNRIELVHLRETDRFLVAGSEQRIFVAGFVMPDRADGMDDVARRQFAADGDDRLAGRQAVAPQTGAQGAAGREDGRAAAAMDGAIDSAAAEQAAVGSIDDGIDCVVSEVADIKTDAAVEKMVQGSAHGGR